MESGEWKISKAQWAEFSRDCEELTTERVGQAFCNRFNPPREDQDKLYYMESNGVAMGYISTFLVDYSPEDVEEVVNSISKLEIAMQEELDAKEAKSKS